MVKFIKQVIQTQRLVFEKENGEQFSVSYSDLMLIPTRIDVSNLLVSDVSEELTVTITE